MKTRSESIIATLRQPAYQYIFSAFMLLVLLSFGAWHCTKGIDLTDEGMYLSAPMRYALGDRPFRDEIMNVTRPFDVLISPIFKFFPDVTLLQMRLLGLGLQVLAVAFFGFFLTKYFPPHIVVFPCFVASIVSNTYDIYSPSYNLLSSSFSLISLTFLMLGMQSSSRFKETLFSIAGGIFLALTVFSYSTQVLLCSVPIFFVLLGLLRSEQNHECTRPCLVFSGTFFFLLGVAVVTLLRSGLMKDVVSGFKIAAATQVSVTGGMLDRPLKWLEQMLKFTTCSSVIFILPAFLYHLFSRLNLSKKYGWMLVPLTALPFFIALVIIILKGNDIRWFHKFLLGYSLVLVFFGVVYGFFEKDKNDEPTQWRSVYKLGVAWGLVSVIVYGVSSGGGFRNSLLGIAPLFVLGSLQVYDMTKSGRIISGLGEIHGAILSVVMTAIVISFSIVSVRLSYHNIYRDVSVGKLTSRFANPKLRGIYTTREKVEVLEQLLNYLNGKIRPGSFFLAYDYIPMLYFLTTTRPSYGTVWARSDWPLPVRTLLVEKMVRGKKFPKYCVRIRVMPIGNWAVKGTPIKYSPSDPLNAFVKSNYCLEKTIGPFEIWKQRLGQ